MPRARKPASPFRNFNASPKVIRPVVMVCTKYPLSLRNLDDLPHERGLRLLLLILAQQQTV